MAAVADHGPGVVRAGVEKLLRQLEGGFLACAVAGDGETRVGLVQPQGMRGDDDGQGTGQKRDGIVLIAHAEARDGGDMGVTEGVAQELLHKVPGERAGIDIAALELAGKVLPLRAGDLKGAAIVVLELEALGGVIVGFALEPGRTKGRFFQLVGQE